MDPFIPRKKYGSEHYIQGCWAEFLKAKGWLVERLIGNAYQRGIPDLFLAHPNHGTRFVDIKVYGRYSFTKAQREKWPIWEENKVGIWILGAESKELCDKGHMLEDYELLFKPPNWRDYWKDSWAIKPDIDKMLEELDND